MATITVESGTGSASSTSYVSEANFTAYNAERAITLTGTYGTASEVLILAMDYLEQQMFKGYKNTKAQALQWPRTSVYIDGYSIDTTEIPALLKEAQMELAIGIDSGTNPLANVPRETIKERVGEIEVEYATGARDSTYLEAAHSKLSKLLKSNGMLQAVRV